MADPTLTLFSSCLLSKWGFNDGDEPDEFLDWLQEHRPDIDYIELDWHRVLIALVRGKLLPALDQSVDVVEIQTIHNPIRAEAIDGVPVAGAVWCGRAPEPPLTPVAVTVPYAEVAALIDTLGAAAGLEVPTDA